MPSECPERGLSKFLWCIAQFTLDEGRVMPHIAHVALQQATGHPVVP